MNLYTWGIWCKVGGRSEEGGNGVTLSGVSSLSAIKTLYNTLYAEQQGEPQ